MFGFFKKKKQLSRKERSEAVLKEENIKINFNLPRVVSEEETTIRTPKEIAQRLVVLFWMPKICTIDIVGPVLMLG